jgi:hypothetical protein
MVAKGSSVYFGMADLLHLEKNLFAEGQGASNYCQVDRAEPTFVTSDFHIVIRLTKGDTKYGPKNREETGLLASNYRTIGEDRFLCLY